MGLEVSKKNGSFADVALRFRRRGAGTSQPDPGWDKSLGPSLAYSNLSGPTALDLYAFVPGNIAVTTTVPQSREQSHYGMANYVNSDSHQESSGFTGQFINDIQF